MQFSQTNNVTMDSPRVRLYRQNGWMLKTGIRIARYSTLIEFRVYSVSNEVERNRTQSSQKLRVWIYLNLFFIVLHFLILYAEIM